jgi:tetratricopeptide (TPR) repeat protein
VLARARSYRPDDVALLELSVQAAADRAQAEKALRELVERRPDDPTHAITLAAMLIDRGKQALAVPLLEALAKSAPPAARSLAAYQLARAWLRQDQPVKALAHLEAAEETAGDKAQKLAVYVLRGRACAALGKVDDALAAYQKAVAADGGASDALAALFELALAHKRRDLAADALRRYTVLAGDRFESLLQAADFALRLGRHDEAFELASRLRPRQFHESIQRVLGLVHLHRGEHARAVHHLERADPTPAVLEGLIRAHLALGDLSAAERESARAGLVLQMPDDLRAARLRVQKLAERRNAVLAPLGPTPASRIKWIGFVDCLVCAEEAHREGRPAAQVEALLAKAGDDRHELGPAQALRGLGALEGGRLREALAAAERAVALCPAEPRGWYVRGRVRLERAAAGAVADLEKAAALGQRKDAAVLATLAEARWQAGHRDDALRDLRDAVRLRPDDARLLTQLRQWEKGDSRPGP